MHQFQTLPPGFRWEAVAIGSTAAGGAGGVQNPHKRKDPPIDNALPMATA